MQMVIYNKGRRGYPGNYRPELSAGGHGADDPVCHHAAHEGHPGDQTQPARVYETRPA